MSVGLIDLSIMNDIANAINLKTGSSGTMTPTQMASNIISIPSGSGGTVAPSTFTTNGVYPASNDNLDGYSIVTVSVPTTSLSQLSVSVNGSYTAPSGYSYDEVTVDVPTITLSSATFSSNSVYSAAAGTGYSEVTVDVPVPTMSTLSVNTNGSYAAPSGVAYNQVDVDVSGTPLSSITISINGSYSAAQGTGYDEITVDVQPTLSSTTFSANGSYSIPVGYDGYGDITVDVSANVMSKTFSGNGIYYASADTVDGYDIVTVDVPGAAVLGSKTISMNGIYNAIDDSLDGYDTVTVNINNRSGTYDWYDNGINVSTTCGAIYLSDSSATNNFYNTYCSQPINILTLTSGDGKTGLININFNLLKMVAIKKIVLDNTVSSLSYNVSGSYIETVREINIENSSCSINAYTFAGTNLKKVTFPSTLNDNFYEGLFKNCKNLETVTLPNNISSISTNCFNCCYNLIDINLNNKTSLTSIGNYAFQYCYNLKGINFSTLSNLTILGDNSFEKTSLKEVKSNHLTSIGTGCFQDCKELIEINLPRVEQFQSSAFKDCINLEKAILNSNNLILQNSCFQGCHKLKNIDLSGVKLIGSTNFRDCYNLTTVNLSKIQEKISDRVFYNCYNLNTVSFSDQLFEIQTYAFYNCTSLDNLELYNCTKNINTNAFNGAKIPTHVTFHGTLAEWQAIVSGKDTLKDIDTSIITFVPVPTPSMVVTSDDFEQSTWQQGYSAGTYYSEMKIDGYNSRIRTKTVIKITTPIQISINNGYKICAMFFDDAGGYLGESTGYYAWATSISFNGTASYVALAIAKTNDGTITINDDYEVTFTSLS